MAVTERLCPCGKPLKRTQTQFCGNVCSAHARKRQPKPCPRCGTPFAGAKGVKYCSLACAHPIKPVTGTCQVCGKPLRENRQKTCSKRCASTLSPTARPIVTLDQRAAIAADHAAGMSRPDIARKYSLTKGQVAGLLFRMGVSRSASLYTPAQDAILRQHYPTYRPASEIIALVNAIGPPRMTTCQVLSHRARRLGLRRPADWAWNQPRAERTPPKPIVVKLKVYAAPKAKSAKIECKQRNPKEIPERLLRTLGMQLDLPLSQRGNLDAVNRAWKKLPDDDPLKQEHGGCPSFVVVTYKQYRSGAAA